MFLTATAEAASQPGWLDFLIAGATGGLAVKLLDVLYQEVRRRGERKSTVEEFVQTQVDPILKAADELVGKIYSLSQEDFASLPRRLERDNARNPENLDLASVLFLFAQFWATIEILRRDSVYVRLASSTSGRKLTKFLACLESRKVRALVRARQRAVGESLIEIDRTKIRPMGFARFVADLSGESTLTDWIEPLVDLLTGAAHGSRSEQSENKQRLLQYVLVLHAMIDDLDEGHTTTRERPPLTTKLSPATRRDLRHRVFAVYLPFVEKPERYWRHPRPGA